MMLKTLKLKNLMMAALLLSMAGCGCTDDDISTNPGPLQPSLLMKARMPAIPVAPPQAQSLRIDVMFVLDDSDSMNDEVLGILPNNSDDRRERSQAAQAIMRRLQQTVATRLANEYAADQLPAPTLDFAYGVSRFEDFGGEFTSVARRSGPIDGQNNDQDARPFILNMPLLREAHPQFSTLFGSAIAREAPGDGNPYIVPPFVPGVPPEPQRVKDPQTAIEALFQLAAPANPDGTFGGFDGNGDNDTLDSGRPTSIDGALNPQTAPGSSGDVPAIGFQAIDPTSGDYDDPDGEPLFRVRDETNTPVSLGSGPSIASGNIGGAGWREDSIRFIVLASDIATVAPMRTPPTGTPEDPAFSAPPGKGIAPDLSDSQTIASTDGGAGAPRQARTVLTLAFDGGAAPDRARRTGTPGGDVSPTNAHTIEDAIEALNARNIEVLLLGASVAAGLDTKPGATGVNGDVDSVSVLSNDEFDPSSLSKVQSDPAPWFWMNAVTRLTTPEITSIAASGAEEMYPAVYNLGTVWPLDDVTPDFQGTDESNIRDTVTDDLVERIRGWLDPIPGDANSPYQAPTSGGVLPLDQRPPLPVALYEFNLNVDVIPATDDVIQLSSETAFTITPVEIPTYWSDQPAPADVTVVFPTEAPGAPGPVTYGRRDDAVAVPASRSVGYQIFATFTGNFQDPVGETSDADTRQKISDRIIARGNGLGAVLPTATTQVTVADAEFVVTVRAANAPGQGIVLGTVTTGCAIVAEQTFALNFTVDTSDQEGGICPFPPRLP